MTVLQAKLILQGYRAGTADDADPQFSEALALLKSDPELAAWWRAWQSIDRPLVAEHARVAPPEGLREKILAGVSPSAIPVPSRLRFAVVPAWIGLAAALAIAILTGRHFRGPEKIFAADSALAAFAIEDAQHPETHGGKGEAMKNLNRVLKLPTTRLSDKLPADFETLRDTGCRKLSVGGRDVLEVCFKRGGPGLHCYLARRRDFPELTAPARPTITDKGNASIATWSDETNVYIVVTVPDHAVLEKLL